VDATCATCDRPVTLEPGPVREARQATVAVILEHAPRWRCGAGHLASAIGSAGTADVLAQVRDALPYAVTRRLRRGETCASCGQALTMPARRTEWPVTLVRPGGLDVVLTLVVDVPATRCPDCGTDHVPARSQADLEAAVREVLRPT
jgi:predicted RNA-binding Zn-ribbon protein involved in translation (DUF1610 family)